MFLVERVPHKARIYEFGKHYQIEKSFNKKCDSSKYTQTNMKGVRRESCYHY